MCIACVHVYICIHVPPYTRDKNITNVLFSVTNHTLFAPPVSPHHSHCPPLVVEIRCDSHGIVLGVDAEGDLLTPGRLEHLLQLSDGSLHLVAAAQVNLVDHNKDGHVQRQRKAQVLLCCANWTTEGATG